MTKKLYTSTVLLRVSASTNKREVGWNSAAVLVSWTFVAKLHQDIHRMWCNRLCCSESIPTESPAQLNVVVEFPGPVVLYLNFFRRGFCRTTELCYSESNGLFLRTVSNHVSERRTEHRVVISFSNTPWWAARLLSRWRKPSRPSASLPALRSCSSVWRAAPLVSGSLVLTEKQTMICSVIYGKVKRWTCQ